MSEEARVKKGQEVLEKVYGEKMAQFVVDNLGTPFTDETVKHQFGEVWSRPGLSIRDRRLITFGATAMLADADLIAIQAKGALISGDLDKTQFDEAVLHLAFYVGWGKATQIQRGVYKALAEYEAEQQEG